METNRPWNWRWTVSKTSKMMLVRPLMTNLKMTVRADSTVSSCGPFPQLIKALPYWLSVRGNWPLDRCHHPPVAHILSKANFPFHQPGLFMTFEQWAARLYLSVTSPRCGSHIAYLFFFLSEMEEFVQYLIIFKNLGVSSVTTKYRVWGFRNKWATVISHICCIESIHYFFFLFLFNK